MFTAGLLSRQSCTALLLCSLLCLASCGDDSSDPGGNTAGSGGPESSFFPDDEGSGAGSGLVTIQVTLESTKPSGDDWDAFGGQPDPYIKVGGVSFESEGCQDTRFCSFTVSGTGPFAIEVFDADVSEDDDAGAVLCAAGSTCTTDNGGATVTVK